jgi:hypothetical protein
MMMNEHSSCKKVLLAVNEGCRVMYCESHCMAEVEIGALSLRFDVEAFASLQELFDEAIKKIAVIQASKSMQHALMTKLRNAH